MKAHTFLLLICCCFLTILNDKKQPDKCCIHVMCLWHCTWPPDQYISCAVSIHKSCNYLVFFYLINRTNSPPNFPNKYGTPSPAPTPYRALPLTPNPHQPPPTNTNIKNLSLACPLSLSSSIFASLAEDFPGRKSSQVQVCALAVEGGVIPLAFVWIFSQTKMAVFY